MTEPKWNEGAEKAVLGAALLSPEHLHAVVSVLKTRHFYRPAHQIIYGVLLDLHGRDGATDAVTVATELTRRGEINRVGGAPYLHTLMEATPTVTNVMGWAGDVIESAKIRDAEGLGERILQIVRSPNPDFAKLHEFIAAFVDDAPSGAAETSVDRLLAELLDTGDLENIPALEPLIADTLFLDTLARLFGPSGSLKSFFALDFAGCVGTGKDWHGRTVRQGTVIYIVAEGVKGVRKRVRAWEQHYGRKMTGVKFLPRPVQVKSPEWSVLIEACRRIRPALVIIDTQARVTVGVEENSATEMGVVNELMERLRVACEACVLVVHHSGAEATDRGRGSTAVKGAMQTELSVSRKGKGVRDTRVMLKASKQKDDEDGDELVFVLERIELSGEFKGDGSPVTSVVLVPEAAARGSAPAPPGSVAHLVEQLDAAGIPEDYGRTRTHKALLSLGFTAGKEKLDEVVRARKNRPRDLPYSPVTQPALMVGAGVDVSADQTGPGQAGDRLRAGAQNLPALPPSLEGGQVGQPGPDECAVCGWPVDSIAHDQKCGDAA